MGIRFACHVCAKQLNIKSELAGRRGICPSCAARFRIPTEDAERSTPVEEPQRVLAQPSVPQVPGDSAATSEGTAVMPNEVSPASVPSVSSGAESPAATSNTAVAEPSPALNLLVSDPSATWYVRPSSGGQYGPASGEVLQQWIGEGRVASNALLWRDGWPQWREATEALPELAKQFPDPTANGEATEAKAQPAGQKTASAPIVQTGKPAASSTAANGDEFGYEDSDFATRSQKTSYGAPITEHANFKGRDSVGAQRRDKSSKRTLSIVVLGLTALLLVSALAIVLTR